MPQKKIKLKPIAFVILGILFGVFLKLFILDFLHVFGTSMENTIEDNSIIAVNKLSFGIAIPFRDSLLVQWKKPKINDIVIYLYNNKIVVKRCVAIEGDRLDFLKNSDYSLLVNGKTIPLTEEQYNNLKFSSCVPENFILAVGDNYANSIDSRTYGFIPVKNILGKVLWK